VTDEAPSDSPHGGVDIDGLSADGDELIEVIRVFHVLRGGLHDPLAEVLTTFGYEDLHCSDRGPLIGSRPCPLQTT
jgi:hypothetical protein